jgi:hypothetical protein
LIPGVFAPREERISFKDEHVIKGGPFPTLPAAPNRNAQSHASRRPAADIVPVTSTLREERKMQARLTAKPIEEVVSAIQQLDLESVKLRVMDAELGEGWTREYAESIETAYKTYLTMVVKYQEHAEDIMLSKDVDEFWHTHILQTMKYADDCQKVFGTFLHHDPHIGARTPALFAKRTVLAKKTRELYEQEFGAGKPADAAWSGYPIPSAENATSAEFIQAKHAAMSNIAIRPDNAAMSNIAIHAGNAAMSNVAIGAADAAMSNIAIHSDNAAMSNIVIHAGNAAMSNVAIRAGNAAMSNVAIPPANVGARHNITIRDVR